MPTPSLKKFREDLALAALAHRISKVNPFTPARIALEKEMLKDHYISSPTPWNLDSAPGEKDPNLKALAEITSACLKRLRPAIADSKLPSRDFLNIRALAYWAWFHENLSEIDAWIENCHSTGSPPSIKRLYNNFQYFTQSYLHEAKLANRNLLEPVEHAFASLMQIRRAFNHTFRQFIGSSKAAMNTRRMIWESLFTFDMDRFFGGLYKSANRTVTLITGPSGSGKEVIAQAIGQSQYIAFDPDAKAFAENFTSTYLPVNLAALSSTLIESELFGHKKGAFTGADSERVGYFEACGQFGTIFLDEIGETSEEIQVKLLRLLQAREFYRIGETIRRPFRGKCIAATNRNLPEAVLKQTFREDLFYRLQSDCIQSPSLRDCIYNDPDELRRLSDNIVLKLTGSSEDASLNDIVFHALLPHIHNDWSGNFRELEQAVRQIIIRGNYTPFKNPRQKPTPDCEPIYQSDENLDEMIARIVTRSFKENKTLQATAQKLSIDPRTVKKYIEASER